MFFLMSFQYLIYFSICFTELNNNQEVLNDLNFYVSTLSIVEDNSSLAEVLLSGFPAIILFLGVTRLEIILSDMGSNIISAL